jgi:hypothetical protein
VHAMFIISWYVVKNIDFYNITVVAFCFLYLFERIPTSRNLLQMTVKAKDIDPKLMGFFSGSH